MSLIEGVGDEVTIIFGILLLVLLLTIAWISTHTRDIPFFSLVIVEISQRAERRQAQQNAANSQQREQHETENTELRDESISGVDQQSESEVQLPEENKPSEESSSTVSSDETGETPSNATSCHSHSESDKLNKDGVIQIKDVEKEIQAETGNTTEHECKHLSTDSDAPREESNVNSSILLDTDLRQRRIAFFEQKKSPSDKREFSVNNVVEHSVTTRNDPEPVVKTTTEPLVSPESSDTRLPSQTDKNPSEENLHNRSKSRTNEQADTSHTTETDALDGSIRVRLKYLNDSQRLVLAKPDDTIAQFRRQNFADELEQNKLIRFIFNGQEMRDDNYSLQSYNIGDNSVIHCLITQSVQQDQSQNEEIEVDLDIGNFMFPLFAVVLGLIWFTRISYRQYFNATSTVSLVAITFLFLVAYASTFRRNQNHVHID